MARGCAVALADAPAQWGGRHRRRRARLEESSRRMAAKGRRPAPGRDRRRSMCDAPRWAARTKRAALHWPPARQDRPMAPRVGQDSLSPAARLKLGGAAGATTADISTADRAARWQAAAAEPWARLRRARKPPECANSPLIARGSREAAAGPALAGAPGRRKPAPRPTDLDADQRAAQPGPELWASLQAQARQIPRQAAVARRIRLPAAQSPDRARRLRWRYRFPASAAGSCATGRSKPCERARISRDGPRAPTGSAGSPTPWREADNSQP